MVRVAGARRRGGKGGVDLVQIADVSEAVDSCWPPVGSLGGRGWPV